MDVSFYAEELNDMAVVIDIALAHEALKEVLTPLNYQNLDELPQFAGKLTTTEFLAKYIHDEVKAIAPLAFKQNQSKKALVKITFHSKYPPNPPENNLRT